MKAMKKKAKAVKKKASKRLGRRSLSQALITLMKERSGRSDLKFAKAPKAATKTMHDIPLKERAGYPLKFPKGSVDPKTWCTGPNGEKPIIVDFSRPDWLPDEWGQGVKSTNFISRSGSGNGGTYTVLMHPDGKCFYHRKHAEEYWGKDFSLEDGRNGQIRKAELMGKQFVQVVRADIRESEYNCAEYVGVDSDKDFFGALTPAERKHLPSKDEFHFCIVSARRVQSPEGLQDIFMVQAQFEEAGIIPTWYVDEASVKEYRRVGLKAVVGGRLTDARNKCLQDAARLGKACVQCSDDISAWEYRHGKKAAVRTDDAVNAAHSKAKRFIISPVSAARFILAKMRATPGEKKPQLGGVYMLGSCARTFAGADVSTKHFCIGDFFVVDKSKVRFDKEMTLKEDYDFSCSHIKAHGSVLRCNRMTLQVKHYSNVGGAVDERDKKGMKERMNIAILNRKWPGVFSANPKRQNEVIMRWKTACEDLDDDKDEDNEERSAKKPTKAKKATIAITKKSGLKKQSLSPGLPQAKAILTLTGKVPKSDAIAKRCKKVAGRSVGKAVGTLVRGVAYSGADLKYDLRRGFLGVKGRGKN